jgi:CRISPR/Cas system-associated exonuclease Cas4 (RecB family)
MTDLIFKRVKSDPVEQAILGALDRGYLAQSKKSEWLRKKSFAPSTLVYGHGKCPRYWNLAFRGGHFAFDDEPTSIANMKNGTDSHARLQEAWRQSGILKESEKKIISDDPPVFGFMDVLFEIDGEEYPGEIKTSKNDPFEWRKAHKRGSDYHTLQLLVYLKILNKKKGFLIYENKDTHEVVLIPVEMTEENKAKIDEVFDWMQRVYAAYKENKLTKRGFNKNNKICKACPLSETCLNAPVGELKIPALEVKL